MRVPAMIGVAALLAVGSESAAQAVPERGPAEVVGKTALAAGERIRVATSGAHLVGTLALLDGQSLTIVLETDGTARKVPVREVRSLEVSEGRPNRVAWAGYGAVVGFAAVTLLAAALMDESEFDSGYAVPLGTGALFGLPLGAMVGSAMAPKERWRPIEFASGGARGHVGIRFQVRF